MSTETVKKEKTIEELVKEARASFEKSDRKTGFDIATNLSMSAISDSYVASHVGAMYLTKDNGKAYEWLKHAAKLEKYGKTGVIQWLLGQMELNGIGCHTNIDNAIKWYRISAERSFVFGCYELGKCYEQNIVADANDNLVAATNWYFKAIALENESTKKTYVHLLNEKYEPAKEAYERVVKKIAERCVSSVEDGKNTMDGECRTFMLPGNVEMEMVYVAPGEFKMGSEDGDSDEKPVHPVNITKGYWIGKYPVTQAQWNALVTRNNITFSQGVPNAWFRAEGSGRDMVSGLDTSNFPMEGISWDDCDILVRALNSKETSQTRWMMPTEAQWEFAARGGNKSRGHMYSGGDNMDEDDLGWYYGNSGNYQLYEPTWDRKKLNINKCRPHPVNEKNIANELGIVGMSGNVWEWCADWYGSYPTKAVTNPKGPASGDVRVLRGGSWYNIARHCRSAVRGTGAPGYRNFLFGFRLACSAGPHDEEQSLRRLPGEWLRRCRSCDGKGRKKHVSCNERGQVTCKKCKEGKVVYRDTVPCTECGDGAKRCPNRCVAKFKLPSSNLYNDAYFFPPERDEEYEYYIRPCERKLPNWMMGDPVVSVLGCMFYNFSYGGRHGSMIGPPGAWKWTICPDCNGAIAKKCPLDHVTNGRRSTEGCVECEKCESGVCVIEKEKDCMYCDDGRIKCNGCDSGTVKCSDCDAGWVCES